MNTEAYNKMMKEMAPGAFTAWWSMIQADAELAGEPIKPEAVVLHYMGNGASATVTASALDEVCRILAERATPAAASAGAAGTIDTPPAFNDAMHGAFSAILNDIDRADMEAIWEGMWRAATAPVSAAPTLPEGWTLEWDAYSAPGTIRLSSGKSGGAFIGKPTQGEIAFQAIMYRFFSDVLNSVAAQSAGAPVAADGPIYGAWTAAQMEAVLLAGAPVSTAPDAWITPQVAQNLDRQYRDGFLAGWSASEAGDEQTLAAVQSRVGKIADYQEGAPVSAAEPAPQKTNAPILADQGVAGRLAHVLMNANASLARPADGQELPAPNHEEAAQLAAIKRGESNLARCYLDLATRKPQELPMLPALINLSDRVIYGPIFGYTAAQMQDYARAALATRQPQQQPTTYRLVVGWESARMEPDPAGEWVKRADLAMGQAQVVKPVIAGYFIRDHGTKYWTEVHAGENIGEIALYFSDAESAKINVAKQGGKEQQ